MHEVTRWRKRPVVVEAVRWTGGNIDEILVLVDRGYFEAVAVEDRAEDPDQTAAVFDKLHSTWVRVYDGQWIVKGVRGEFYPCADDVFRETYQPAGEAQAVPASPHLSCARCAPADSVADHPDDCICVGCEDARTAAIEDEEDDAFAADAASLDSDFGDDFVQDRHVDLDAGENGGAMTDADYYDRIAEGDRARDALDAQTLHDSPGADL